MQLCCHLLSSSSPSLLPQAFAGHPQDPLPAHHLPLDDHESWGVITLAFNCPKINCLVQTVCPVSFLHSLEVERHPPFPVPALGWTRRHRIHEGDEINLAPCFPPTYPNSWHCFTPAPAPGSCLLPLVHPVWDVRDGRIQEKSIPASQQQVTNSISRPPSASAVGC